MSPPSNIMIGQWVLFKLRRVIRLIGFARAFILFPISIEFINLLEFVGIALIGCMVYMGIMIQRSQEEHL